MYKQIYHSEFKDIDENNIRIEIYKKTNESVVSKELLLSAEPIIIEYSSDDIFQPTKLSSASINVLTKEILLDLYTSKLNQITCKIYKNDNLFWFGFLSPNLYSSDYIDETNMLTLEFIDTLSQLEYMKYQQINSDNNNENIYSIKSIIFSILNRIDEEKTINNIYISSSILINDSNDILNKMYMQERNLFDEYNEPMTAKEVLQEIAKYISMTLMQWGDSYYFLDYNSISESNSEFKKYSRTNSVISDLFLDIETININEIIHESNCTLSLDDTYNKITIIANNNAVSNLIPDIINDEEDIINQNSDPNNYYISSQIINNEEYKLTTAFFDSKKNWGQIRNSSEEITIDNYKTKNESCYIQKVCDYKKNDGEPSSLNWKTFLTFTGYYNKFSSSYNRYLRLLQKNIQVLKGGYFIVNCSFKLTKSFLAHDILGELDANYKEAKYADLNYWFFQNTMIPCKLMIGNYYYDGEQWLDHSVYERKESLSYYRDDLNDPVCTNWETKWYCYWDSNNLKRFCTESHYNSLASNIKKECEQRTDRRMQYYYGDYAKNTAIFVSEEYYHECRLRDCFYLVHKNKVDDKVFDEIKTLTNTVSYKLNLIDSEDGVAIPLPKKMLVGELIFELYEPNQLGKIPQFFSYNQTMVCNAFHFSDLTLKYSSENYTANVFDMSAFEADVKYTNTINEDYVNEFDDVELYVNTYNKQANSYSYVLEKIDDNYDYIYSTYNVNTSETLKQEEHIIKKYYNYYSTPKFIYENKLKLDNITPYSLFYESTLDKNFILNSCVIDVQNNAIETTLSEANNNSSGGGVEDPTV